MIRAMENVQVEQRPTQSLGPGRIHHNWPLNVHGTISTPKTTAELRKKSTCTRNETASRWHTSTSQVGNRVDSKRCTAQKFVPSQTLFGTEGEAWMMRVFQKLRYRMRSGANTCWEPWCFRPHSDRQSTSQLNSFATPWTRLYLPFSSSSSAMLNIPPRRTWSPCSVGSGIIAVAGSLVARTPKNTWTVLKLDRIKNPSLQLICGGLGFIMGILASKRHGEYGKL